MRLFRTKKVASAGGNTLKIKNVHCKVSSSRKAAAVAVTTKAGYWVSHALAVLQQPKLPADVKQILNRCFMILPTDTAELNTIRANLVLLQNGICNANVLTLKIAPATAATVAGTRYKPSDVMGYVNVRGDDSRGDVTIDPKVLKGGRLTAIVTFLHEATHKFCQFDDFSYMDPTGRFFREEVTDSSQLMGNPDSYAWLVAHIGEKQKVLGGADG